MHCLLVGNYGDANFGDEALKEYFLSTFPDIHWTVVSARPDASKAEVSRLPGGLRTLLGFRWIATVSAYRSADAVVFGGGTLFTDAESVFACFLWWMHARFADFFGKPLLFAFQGIGPFRTRIGEWLARDAVRRGRFLSVRDSLSSDRTKQWSLSIEIVQTYDPLFTLLEKKKSDEQTKNVFTIIPRRNSGKTFQSAVAEEIRRTQSTTAVILSLQPESAEEQESLKEIQKNILEIHTTIVPIHTSDELVQNLQNASFVVTQRFHGAIAALALGVPFRVVRQSAGDKLEAIDRLDKEELRRLVETGEEALRSALHPETIVKER